ncbi:hypothetical protein GCM10028800_09490 [Nesterenkonia populi]
MVSSRLDSLLLGGGAVTEQGKHLAIGLLAIDAPYKRILVGSNMAATSSSEVTTASAPAAVKVSASTAEAGPMTYPPAALPAQHAVTVEDHGIERPSKWHS